MASFGNDPTGRPVYAKLVGENVVFYMYGFSATLGRGTRGDETADFLVSTESGISRLHARIYYSNMEQGFELEVLGKNGVYVNGKFVTKGEKPLLLHSQAEIVMGKVNPVVLTFLLPAANTTQMDKKKVRYKSHADHFNLVAMIGETLVGTDQSGLTLVELNDRIWDKITFESEGRNPYQSKEILQNCLRHVLSISSYFCPCPQKASKKGAWMVRPQHEKRFATPAGDLKRAGVTVMSTDTAKRPRMVFLDGTSLDSEAEQDKDSCRSMPDQEKLGRSFLTEERQTCPADFPMCERSFFSKMRAPQGKRLVNSCLWGGVDGLAEAGSLPVRRRRGVQRIVAGGSRTDGLAVVFGSVSSATYRSVRKPCQGRHVRTSCGLLGRAETDNSFLRAVFERAFSVQSPIRR